MGQYEDELTRIAQAGEWDARHLARLDTALESIGRAVQSLADLSGTEAWRGDAATAAAGTLNTFTQVVSQVRTGLDTANTAITAANEARRRAVEASGELPAAEVDPMWKRAAQVGATVVFPPLGTLASDVAIGTIESWLGGQREDAARAARDELARVADEQAKRLDVATRQARDGVWNLPAPTPISILEPDPTDIDPVDIPEWNRPRSGGGGTSGSSSLSVDGSVVGVAPIGSIGTIETGAPGDSGSAGGGRIGIDDGDGTGGDGGIGGDRGPGGGSGSNGTLGTGTGTGSGPGLLAGVGGAAIGAAALAVGAKAAAGGSLFGGAGGGAGAGAIGRGAAGAGGAGGAGGASGVGGAGGGLNGRSGGLEGGAARNASSTTATTGSGAAGGRGMSMVGGQPGGSTGSAKRDQRAGLGGPIAPKLEDDEAAPRSRGAGAGGRTQ
ncbi:hypothetical protein [Agromyces larvae]|uniref:PPE domain-containing protein n=1 Tax=Agromyces larvae TaxID=2929802 RepID=A0ABY4C1V3_9MICO|nr:hypothetical protein [Agromyces larvae]UOE43948.1 hypothetical protein MTO99_17585 [Agromyces larvae]